MIWYNDKYLSGFYSMTGSRPMQLWDSFTRQYVGLGYWAEALLNTFAEAYNRWNEYITLGTVDGKADSDFTLEECMGDVMLQLGSVWGMGIPHLAADIIVDHQFVSPSILDITWGVEFLAPGNSTNPLYAIWSYRLSLEDGLVDFHWQHHEGLNEYLEWQNLLDTSDTVELWADFIMEIWETIGPEIFTNCIEATLCTITIDNVSYNGANCTWDTWMNTSDFNTLGLVKSDDMIMSSDGSKVLQVSGSNVLPTDVLDPTLTYVLVELTN